MSIAMAQRIKELEHALAELRARVAALEAQAEKKPVGRPKKEPAK